MNSERAESSGYPLLENLLKQKGLRLKGIYTNRDAAEIFGVVPRTIQQWSRDGMLPTRNLPGRGRYLSEDLETCLRTSLRKAQLPVQGTRNPL